MPKLSILILPIAAAMSIQAAHAAPSGKAPANIGPIAFHYGRMYATGVGKPSTHTLLSNGFEIQSINGNYDVTGVTADIVSTTNAVQNITAKGSADKQVTVEFFSEAEGSKVTFLADQAVLTPSPIDGQPKRQSIVFTGHVHMRVANPMALEGVSESTMKKAVVYIGSGPDYPQVEAIDVDGSAVPRSGKE